MFNHATESKEPAFPLEGNLLIYSRSKTSSDGWGPEENSVCKQNIFDHLCNLHSYYTIKQLL